MNGNDKKDLIVLLADKNMHSAFRGILKRVKSLGIRDITYDIYVHPLRDPGCLLEAHDFLRPFAHKYCNALVAFDRMGCGKDTHSRSQLENEVEHRLSCNGWGDNRAVIVLEPELDIWVWSDSKLVPKILGWKSETESLREWLKRNHYTFSGVKPHKPKEALEKILRELSRPRSSSIYLQLAERVSLTRCTDPSFQKLRQLLNLWFGRTGQASTGLFETLGLARPPGETGT